MGILRKEAHAFVIYENQALGKLVAIPTSDQLKLKTYWKAKDKTQIDAFVEGFPFVQTDEQESLKIDFSKGESYSIPDLKKFN